MRHKLKTLLVLSTILMSGSTAFAQYSIENPGTLNNTETYGMAISANGSRIVGRSLNASGQYEIYTYTPGGTILGLSTLSQHYQFTGDPPASTFISSDGNVIGGIGPNRTLMRWTSGGGLVDLGTVAGGAVYTDPFAMSRSGNAFTGRVFTNQWSAFLWRDGIGFIEIPGLGGYRDGRAINADGSALAGYENGNLFRWDDTTGTTILGRQAGGYSDTVPSLMSDDGNVIAGISVNGAFSQEAFRWTPGGGIAGLGTLGGGNSNVLAMNPTGSILVGESQNSGFNTEAFKWTVADNMVGLGTLGGAGTSSAQALTADGTKIVGTSNGSAVVWDAANSNTIESLADILMNEGVDLTGWSLTGATGISDDGSKIVGNGTFNGVQNAFLMIGPAAITTPEELAESFMPAQTSSQQLQASVAQGVGQSMMIARNALSGYFTGNNIPSANSSKKSLSDIDTAAGGSYDPLKSARRKAVYATGAFGVGQQNDFSNNTLNGTAGMLLEVSPNLALGVGLLSSNSRISTRFSGESRSSAHGANVITSYEPPSGLRVYGAAFLADLNISSDRNYLNGAGIDQSRGKGEGTGYGATVMTGYEFPVLSNIRLMPYVEAQVARTSINSYTEQGGALPLTIAEQNDDYVSSRLGGQISHDITPKLTTRVRAAWGHRYTQGAATVATTAGITQVMPAFDGDRDWAEAGVSMNYKLSESTTISTDISGRSSQTAEPAASAMAGIVWSWY